MKKQLNRRQLLHRLLQTGLITNCISRTGSVGAVESSSKIKRIVVLGQTHNTSAWHRVPEFSKSIYGVGSAANLKVDTSKGIRSGRLPNQLADLAKGYDLPLLNGSGNKLRDQMCIINGMMAPGQSRHGHIELEGYAVTYTGSLFEKPDISFEQILAQNMYSNVPPKRAMYFGKSGSLFFFDKNGNSMQSSAQTNAMNAYKDIVFPATVEEDDFEVSSKSTLYLKNQVLVNKLAKDRKELLSTKRLSKQDQLLLEVFYDNLSDISASLKEDTDSTQNSLASLCKPLSEGSFNSNLKGDTVPPSGSYTSLHKQMQEYAKVIKLAFLCDHTRVVGINLGGWDNLTDHSALYTDRSEAHGEYDVHHTVWHKMGARKELVDVSIDYVSLAAELANELMAVPTPTGTMLDETLIVLSSEIGTWSPTWSDDHNHTDYSFVTFGGSNALATGQYIDAADKDRMAIQGGGYCVNHLLQTFLSGFGLERSQWEPYTSGAGIGHYKGSVHSHPYVNTTFNVLTSNDEQKRRLIPGLLKGGV